MDRLRHHRKSPHHAQPLLIQSARPRQLRPYFRMHPVYGDIEVSVFEGVGGNYYILILGEIDFVKFENQQISIIVVL